MPVFPLSAECRAAVEIAAEAARESRRAGDGGASRRSTDAALIDLYLQLLLPILATDMPTPLVKAMEMGRPIAKAMARGEPFSRGKWALYSAATHHDWLKADEARQRLKRNVAEFFTRWQAIIAPVAPSTAFEHVDDRRCGDAPAEGRWQADALSRVPFVDRAGDGVPPALAAVIPVPRGRDELPCGVQIIGPEGGDFDVLAIAEAIEAQIGGFQRPPEDNLAAAARFSRRRPARSRPSRRRPSR